MLTQKNFSVWSIKMQAVIEVNDMWNVVDPANPKAPVDAKWNEVAHVVIFSVIPKDVLFFIVKKESSRDMWMTLKTMFLRAERV